jgi:hypothetical protein
MKYPRCSPGVYRVILGVLFFCGLVGYGIYWARSDLVPFFMTRPSINGLIAGLGVLGLILSFVELVRVVSQAAALDTLSARLKAGETDSHMGPEEVLAGIRGGLVVDRCKRVLYVVSRGGPGSQEAVSLLSDADVESEEGRGAFARYLIGVMIFLGLIGTFWGLLITVSGVKEVLASLEPGRIDDPASFLLQLKASMGDLLGGMSTAFSTSLFGLGGSVVLGFVEMQTRQARSRLLTDLDRLVIHFLVLPQAETPASAAASRPFPTVSDVLGDERYLLASQQTLGENLRVLTEVINVQTSTEEKIANSMVEMKGSLEAIRDEEAHNRETLSASNQMSKSALERLDNVARHMEGLINEMRLTRESSDKTGKALLDRLKLEGEITNKTLSLGFSDMIRVLKALGVAEKEITDPESGKGQ